MSTYDQKPTIIEWVLGSLLVIVILAGAFGLFAAQYEENVKPTTTTTSTTTTTTEPHLDSAATIFIGSADMDPTLFNMEWLGFDVDYVSGSWYVNDIFIGIAPTEDGEFVATGPVWLINVMNMIQIDAKNAGAEIHG